MQKCDRMKMKFVTVALILVVVLVFLTEVNGKRRDSKVTAGCKRKRWRGCIIGRNNRCQCGKTTVKICRDPYTFRRKRDCKRSINQQCTCLNGGICLRKKSSFKCSCVATGFYGPSCETPCPTRNPKNAEDWKHPTDCIFA